MVDWQLVSNFFVALLAIVNPIGKVPLWIEASKYDESGVRHIVALLVTLTGAALLLVFLLFGQSILGFFGIDLGSFRIGGGIVILLLGINMLNGRAVDLDLQEQNADASIVYRAKARFGQVIVPLAVPFIAGPGSITTVLIYGARSGSWLDAAALAGVLLMLMALVYVTLLSGHRIRGWIGELPLQVLTRVFGLIIVAVAAQFIVEGLGEVFPALIEPGSEIRDDLREGP